MRLRSRLLRRFLSLWHRFRPDASLREERLTLKLQVLRLGSMVEESLSLARAVLAGPNMELAPQVRRGDDRIDRLYRQLEEHCVALLGLHSPGQWHTRQLIVYMLAVRDLERIGDYCKELASASERLLPYQPLLVRDELLTMMDRSRSLLAMALEALSRNDTSAGARLIALDDLVDQDYAALYKRITRHDETGSMPREVLVLVALAMRALERLADHAVNVSRRVSHGATPRGGV